VNNLKGKLDRKNISPHRTPRLVATCASLPPLTKITDGSSSQFFATLSLALHSKYINSLPSSSQRRGRRRRRYTETQPKKPRERREAD
jgi:hypothetical protein